jgi:hypothetical protein
MTDSKNNSGNSNSGSLNSGNYNSGSLNSGDRNSGHYNSGYRNSGNYNSGHYNSGSLNSGNYNSGNSNSGNYNSGHYNSGYYNSGDRNSGHYNSGYRNSGYFNTTTPKVRLFNKDSDIDRDSINIPYINLKINEWIPETRMTDIQKKNDPQFFVKKGTLITRTYQEAFILAWSELSKDIKQQFLDLPNFDADIFLEITGVDVRTKLTPLSCSGKIVEIDGKKYKLTEVGE